MKTLTHIRRNHAGFSLTELMVAVVIGLIILAAVASLFVNANKASNNASRTARIQENGRFAMYYLVHDLRMTGYMGCNRDMASNLANDLNTKTGFYYGTTTGNNVFLTPLEAVDNVTAYSTPAWQPSGSNTMPSNPGPWNDSTAAIAEPDMITLRRVAMETQLPLAVAMVNYTDPITIATTQAVSFQNHPVILVADCAHSDLVQVTGTAISGVNTQLQHSSSSCTGISPCNSTNDLGYAYGTAAYVLAYTTRIYYIGLNKNNVPALYISDNGGTPVDLVDGIESMKILYGVAAATGQQPDPYAGQPPAQYVKASAMSTDDWKHVVSLKIGILARTMDTLDTDIDTNTYNVNGTTVGPFNDRNTRRVFSSTVLLKDMVMP